MRKSVLIAVLIFGIAAGFFFGALGVQHFSVMNIAKISVAGPEFSEITLLFVGDIMLSRNIGAVMAAKKDYQFFFASTSELTRSADIAFANLESPITTRGIRSGSKFSFRAAPQVLDGLTYAGFDIVSIANNHIWDYGRQGLIDTYETLERNGVFAIGAGDAYKAAHTPRILDAKGTKVAFLAYTNLLPASLGLASSKPAVARYDDETLKADIARAEKLADFIVVSFHWGDEYKTTHNAEQERVGKLAIDAGANLVIGHHPHVVQEVEEYHGGYIAYSLGNFIFDQNFSKDTKHGLALLVTLKDNKITSVTQKEVAFTAEYQPYFIGGLGE